ncbi:di-heme oxidoredictase family protein [Oceanobacter sp. 5_MG-2023]|uniref:di-heme oxidoreductase family protein n=2 Tax=Gammaproteobacteria TaxID=1236 RepID=UPI0026E1E5CE|nr:di-heme oxidoredictase family protein [Oceanobacter sp. 5_MG-2023]MDO6681755.1 di-heme oxidoredictase family protein [Oceanobacter sp. 5_MG-2023]
MMPPVVITLRLLLLWLILLPNLAAADPITSSALGRRALSQPMPGLTATELEQFLQGRSLFAQMWVISPSADQQVDGLGPLYNAISCASCHPGNGHGRAPDRPGQAMRSMLVRLSLPGHDIHGGPRPHPFCGDQLNEQGVPGVAGEGRASVSYQEQVVRLADDTAVTLRRPQLNLSASRCQPATELLTSARIGPALVGQGLLDAIPNAAILQRADPEDRDADGISGRPNPVYDVALQQMTTGRFGYKANVPNLRQQIASAFHGDLGISSSLFPDQNCTAAQTDCQTAATGGDPELSDEQLDQLVFYHQTLALPARRQPEAPNVQLGEQLFYQAGCESCHRAQFKTAANASPAILANRTIQPWSDLLLHDMGPELADNRPDFNASGQEWRTTPLWGIGLADKVSDHPGFLHDGRARNLLEAILWHGGEASKSRTAVTLMSREQRRALLDFLHSL